MIEEEKILNDILEQNTQLAVPLQENKDRNGIFTIHVISQFMNALIDKNFYSVKILVKNFAAETVNYHLFV